MVDKETIKKVVNAGFKQHLKKLKATYKKVGMKSKFNNFDTELLYNAYNNGFTAGVVLCERLMKKQKGRGEMNGL